MSDTQDDKTQPEPTLEHEAATEPMAAAAADDGSMAETAEQPHGLNKEAARWRNVAMVTSAMFVGTLGLLGWQMSSDGSSALSAEQLAQKGRGGGPGGGQHMGRGGMGGGQSPNGNQGGNQGGPPMDGQYGQGQNGQGQYGEGQPGEGQNDQGQQKDQSQSDGQTSPQPRTGAS